MKNKYSIFSLIKNVVKPVFFSPLIIAQFIGAAPLYFGNKEACKFIVPIFGKLKNILFRNWRIKKILRLIQDLGNLD